MNGASPHQDVRVVDTDDALTEGIDAVVHAKRAL